MLRVGLTGSMGAGKSTVARLLRERGCPVLEADEVVRELTRPGSPALQEIVVAFGPDFLGPGGDLDRRRLAAAVFTDPERLERLNRILHPRVLERFRAWLREQEQAGSVVAVVEAPLLIESGYHRELDRLVVVWCRPEQQFERLAARGLSAEDVQARLRFQMPAEVKRALADDCIDNSGTLEETARQVEALLERWRELARPRESAGEGAR
jgi:dephospho-CoA kinase